MYTPVLVPGLLPPVEGEIGNMSHLPHTLHHGSGTRRLVARAPLSGGARSGAAGPRRRGQASAPKARGPKARSPRASEGRCPEACEAEARAGAPELGGRGARLSGGSRERRRRSPQLHGHRHRLPRCRRRPGPRAHRPNLADIKDNRSRKERGHDTAHRCRHRNSAADGRRTGCRRWTFTSRTITLTSISPTIKAGKARTSWRLCGRASRMRYQIRWI
mmetsp:Transcript_65868/g.182542  ORF Transcript_65868/g.182542 Transcript_65868/m.182542 type:complete len:218 (+) Transcript_65868:1525-2178(+)